MPRTRQELEQIERQLLAPYAQFSGDTRGRDTPSRRPNGARITSATATA